MKSSKVDTKKTYNKYAYDVLEKGFESSQKSLNDYRNKINNEFNDYNTDNTVIVIGSLLIISTAITYFLCRSCIAAGVFKGNVKTLEYLSK